MAKRTDKIDGAEVTKNKKSKFRWITAGATVVGIGATILAGIGIKNIVDNQPSSGNSGTSEPPVTEKIDFSNFETSLNEKMVDVVEYYTNSLPNGYKTGIKNAETNCIIADEDSITFYEKITQNSANYPFYYTEIEFAGSEVEQFITDVYNPTLLKVEESTLTQADFDLFTTSFCDIIEAENLTRMENIDKIENAYTKELSVNLVNKFIETSDLSENKKQEMSAGITTEDVKILSSHFSDAKLNKQSYTYLYSYYAEILVDNYSVRVSTVLETTNKVTDKDVLSQYLLEEYRNNPENFTITYKQQDLMQWWLYKNASNKTTTQPSTTPASNKDDEIELS